MSKLEDDYWNASDTKPFNFEEEVKKAINKITMITKYFYYFRV